MDTIILTGSQGKRFREVIEDCPKTMAEIKDNDLFPEVIKNKQ